ncbi:MAG: glycosyltransferase [Dehalococcoidia bacterium]|nr:glycosyltransferase [Dehalococcoidia bacterium]
MAAATKLAKISIITPFYTMDRFKDVTELLDSIQAQNYKNTETIIVAERSPEFVESIRNYAQEKDYPNVLVLYNQGKRGSYPSRNLGINEASGEIIAFVDDDALLLPGWAEETVRAYAEDSSIIGLTGPILPLWEDEAMNWFPREFYWIFSCTYWDWTEPTEVRNGYGVNISFKREAFAQCGFFKVSLEDEKSGKSDWQQPGGEETEFSIRVKRQTGKRIVYHPHIRVKHKVYSYRLSGSFIRKRAYWEGYAKAIFNKLYRSGGRGKKVLSTEHELLHRIFSKLIPSSIKLLFSQPKIALRQLWVTKLVLACVAVGYLSYNLRNLRPGRRNT